MNKKVVISQPRLTINRDGNGNPSTVILETIRETFLESSEFTENSRDTQRKLIRKETLLIDELPLQRATKIEIEWLHLNETPTIVVKDNGYLYQATISKQFSLTGCKNIGQHMCGSCNKLSAACDEKGGCQKVREFSSHIERYDWITQGLETFNTSKLDTFVVHKCSHFEPYPKRKEPTIKNKEALKLSIAQYVWPEVRSIQDLRKKMYKKL